MKISKIGANLANNKLFNKFKNSKYFELTGLILLIILYSALVQNISGNFLTMGNLNNILKQIVVYSILSCALAFPLINGTFDLSIESIAALSGTCSALLVTDGLFGLTTSLPVAIVLSILIACIIGAINGLIVSRTSIDPFIVTLGTQIAVRGLVYIVSNNTAVTSLPMAYRLLSTGEFFGISYSIMAIIVIFIIVAVILGKTSYGRSIYATGGNYEAAYISGINVKRVRFSTYIVSSALAAIAGILNTARVSTAAPNAAEGYATIAISACAIGGVILSGGKGTVIGIFLGSLMMGMITNGMNLMFIGSNWQYVVRGALMIVAVLYAQWFNKVSNQASSKVESNSSESIESGGIL